MAGEIKKVKWTYWLHLAIGLGFMFVFPMLKPFGTVTEVGMTVLGVFIGMVYLWSALDSIWPSVLGLLLIALSGYVPDLQGYAAVKKLYLDAFGNETVIAVALSMVLFAGVSYVGCTKYMSRFFLSWKILEGRPYIFIFVILLCAYVVSGLTNPLASMLILWPLVTDVCEEFRYKKGDKVFYILVCGIYFGSTLGQPMFPFKGAAYLIVSAFEKASGVTVNYVSYILYNVIMSLLLLVLFLVFIKLVIRPDVSHFKTIKTEHLLREEIPPMNAQQKSFFVMIAVYVAALLIPNFAPKSIGFVKQLASFGMLGVTSICLVALMLIPYRGKPLLDFKAVAKQSFSWDVYFLVAAAIYACNALSDASTGIKPFLIELLQPMLGGRSDIVFVFLILAFAIITTNFANNAGMAIVLIPVLMAFSDQYPGVNSTVLCMSVIMMVFVALLTPAASPYCGILHSRKDLVEYKEIMSLFAPMVFIALLTYTFIGYYLANMLF